MTSVPGNHRKGNFRLNRAFLDEVQQVVRAFESNIDS